MNCRLKIRLSHVGIRTCQQKNMKFVFIEMASDLLLQDTF